ncbi:hypothetical protein GCM10025867_34340 [Frondihabitans sucicola]|uniref:BPL/LPL catalytic domain-containing protein n=2 Tax=Frondihabitans sucicola TaxID=1268041 RepID=A0ABM8GRW3_9MICO|nr:hypothetical protein GCM10025867_34340 [Frondihabitans sucicola]
MHGISLNCDNSLDPYATIVACGIADAGVTTLTNVSGRHLGVSDVVDELETRLAHYLARLAPAARVAAEVSA